MTSEPPHRVDDLPFTHRMRVRFAETDAMGVVHHSSYALYLEEARVEYLRHLGHPYADVRSGGLDFVVHELAVQFRRPLRFDELVDVHLGMHDVRAASYRIRYVVTVDGEIRATASTAHAAVDVAGRPCRLPAWIRERSDGEGQRSGSAGVTR